MAVWKNWFEQYVHMVDVIPLLEALGVRKLQYFHAMLVFAHEFKGRQRDGMIDGGGR